MHIRRLMGYHASGSTQTVELYARDTWNHPMRILGAIIQEIRSKKFMPDKSHAEQFAEGYEPFKAQFEADLPTATKTPQAATGDTDDETVTHEAEEL